MKKANGWAQEVLRFWFSHDYDDWWTASDAFDEEVRERFAIEWARQSRRPIGDFTGDPDTALAAVILFDQFPLAIAKAAIERGYDDGMAPERRAFLYMPFQHSEELKDQRQSLLLFTALGDGRMMPYARKHYEVIEKFGRFPHRNKVLGRKPTAMELAAGDVVPW